MGSNNEYDLSETVSILTRFVLSLLSKWKSYAMRCHKMLVSKKKKRNEKNLRIKGQEGKMNSLLFSLSLYLELGIICSTHCVCKCLTVFFFIIISFSVLEGRQILYIQFIHSVFAFKHPEFIIIHTENHDAYGMNRIKKVKKKRGKNVWIWIRSGCLIIFLNILLDILFVCCSFIARKTELI